MSGGPDGRRPWRALAAAPLLALGAMVAGRAVVALAGPGLLAVTPALAPADAIVVLGGEYEQRPARALQLYRAGLAPRILVSGKGDCGTIAGRLRAGGVPMADILADCASTNTAENATDSVALLRRSGAKSAIIVTSWFHTRRALGCFAGAAPEMTFTVTSAMRRPPRWRLLGGPDGDAAALELLKSAWYRLGHRATCRPERVP